MGITLLLADDSITIQKVVGIIFANEDYELIVVDNGNSALEKAREIKPKVMLVDALMPGKSGYEVCEEVRQDQLLKDIPILLLVGAFEPFDEEKARQSGADDHITKPFESQSLLDKVKDLVELASSRAAAVASVQEDMPVSEPVATPEQIIPEVSVAEPCQEPSLDSDDGSARLFESFRGFVHLGADAAGQRQPAEADTSTVEAEQLKPAAQSEPEAVILLSSVDIVEAMPEDDPWGTFSEAVEEGEAIQLGEVFDETEADSFEASATVEEIEPFALMEEEFSAVAFAPLSSPDEPVATEEQVAAEDSAVSDDPFVAEEFAGAEQPDVFPEEEIVLADEADFSAVEESVESVEPLAPPRSDSISLGDFSPVQEPETVAAPVMVPPQEEQPAETFALPADSAELPFAREEEYIPAAEAFIAPEAVPAAPCPEDSVTFTEEQLAAAISRVSREIIEKIAWEVVPDLAETIIKEEIRKIKEGLGR
ncbi:MAG: response regulator [Geobacteraceae bacterium]|nr:response regulator [Geobacteraceae bacterium]